MQRKCSRNAIATPASVEHQPVPSQPSSSSSSTGGVDVKTTALYVLGPVPFKLRPNYLFSSYWCSMPQITQRRPSQYHPLYSTMMQHSSQMAFLGDDELSFASIWHVYWEQSDAGFLRKTNRWKVNSLTPPWLTSSVWLLRTSSDEDFLVRLCHYIDKNQHTIWWGTTLI